MKVTGVCAKGSNRQRKLEAEGETKTESDRPQIVGGEGKMKKK